MAIRAPATCNAGMNEEAARLIARLQLERLPGEGGFYRQTWLSPERDPTGRPLGSAILYLMTPEDFSALHRLKTPEIWHFHAGDTVEHVQLHPQEAQPRITRLGASPDRGEEPQLVVPAAVWQGARLAAGGTHGWALLGCTLAPAWDEQEWEPGRREDLLRTFPAAAALIHALTR